MGRKNYQDDYDFEQANNDFFEQENNDLNDENGDFEDFIQK